MAQDRAVIKLDMATKLRIGPAKYEYVYAWIVGVYKCARCSDEGNKKIEVLWLMKDGNRWVAFDSLENIEPQSPIENKIMFTSIEEDIRTQGWHKWNTVKKNNEEGWFETTVI